MERNTRENLNSVGGVVFLVFICTRGNIFSWYLGEVRKASVARVGFGVRVQHLEFFFVLKSQQPEIYSFFLLQQF